MVEYGMRYECLTRLMAYGVMLRTRLLSTTLVTPVW
jgi:hypothetical protein